MLRNMITLKSWRSCCCVRMIEAIDAKVMNERRDKTEDEETIVDWCCWLFNGGVAPIDEWNQTLHKLEEAIREAEGIENSQADEHVVEGSEGKSPASN